MSQLESMVHEEIIKPIDVITTFDVAQAKEAMMFFTSSKRIGKVVLTYENSNSLIKVDSFLSFDISLHLLTLLKDDSYGNAPTI